ncbi:MAG: TetR/AcrR family transcriptional regulator [Rubrobacteraceae bacterium]
MRPNLNTHDVKGVSRITVTRADVLGAAVTLFAERGYRATSMRDIAGTLGIRAPSLYNHVRSKQEILFEIMDSAMKRALADCRKAVSSTDDVAEQLRRATESLVLQFLLYPLEVTVSNNEIRSLDEPHRSRILAMRDEYGQGFRNLIERGCSLGRFHVESPRLASYAILEMGNGAKSWFRKGGLYSEAEVARQYSDFALRIVGLVGGNVPSLNDEDGVLG